MATNSKDTSDTAADDVGGVAIQAAPPKEKTKAFLARVFVFSFLVVIGILPMTLLFFGKIDVNDFKDIVLTLAGVLGGPLGIVITSYFKEGSDK